MHAWRLFGSVVVCAVVGCGSVSEAKDDAAIAPTFDAMTQPIDATGRPPTDAAFDARPALTAAPASEITTAGGKVSGSIYKMEVQVGHPITQKPSVGGGKTIEGAAAIK